MRSSLHRGVGWLGRPSLQRGVGLLSDPPSKDELNGSGSPPSKQGLGGSGGPPSKAGGPPLKRSRVAQAHSHTGAQIQTNTQTTRGADQICYQAAGVGLQEEHIKNGDWMQCIYEGRV